MKTCLISLVSDQTIPNILVITHFKPEFLLLISTETMEKRGKSRAILETLKLRGLDYSKYHSILEVLEESIADLQTKATHWLDEKAEDYQFIVNLTCGTKIMSLAAYDLFKDFGSEMVYVPIPRNEFLIPFPKRRLKDPTPLKERLSVQEYLTAYGFRIINKSQLEEYKDRALLRQETTQFLFSHYREILPLLKWLGDLLRPLKRSEVKKGYPLKGIIERLNEPQTTLLSMLGFATDGTAINKKIDESEWNYLRGGWLEERIFLALSAALPKEADILLSSECQDPQGNANEFDVIFTYHNVLNLVECKSLEAAEGSEEKVGATINDFLYKIGALRGNFGLNPRAFLATTAHSILGKDGEVKPRIIERGRQFRTQIIPLLKIQDLEDYFKKIVNPT